MSTPPRLFLVYRSDKMNRTNGALFRELGEHFAVTGFDCRNGLPASARELQGLASCDVCVWWVKFARLMALPAFDWGGWSGLRVLYDWDAAQNYWRWGRHDLRGQWMAAFRKHCFDLLICTSTPTAMRFQEDGVAAEVLLKGYAGDAFHQLGVQRNGLGSFGAPYPPREYARHRLHRAGLAVTHFKCEFQELNHQLNCFEAMLICNMPGSWVVNGKVPFGIRTRLGLRNLDRAPDLLGKTFEAAAAGAVPLVDEAADLQVAGFADQQNCLTYTSFEELIQKWRSVKDQHEVLKTIGDSASMLARSRHTWRHRVMELEMILRRHL